MLELRILTKQLGARDVGTEKTYKATWSKGESKKEQSAMWSFPLPRETAFSKKRILVFSSEWKGQAVGIPPTEKLELKKHMAAAASNKKIGVVVLSRRSELFGS